MATDAQAPERFYQEQIREKTVQLDTLLKKRINLGWGRFIVFFVTAFVAYKLFISFGAIGIVAVVIGIGILLYLVSLDADNNNRIGDLKRRIQINQDEIDILNNNYQVRDDGKEFSPALHDYANDIDLFGPSSLFQLINRCHTEQGKKRLAANFLVPLSTDQIALRQEAAKELSGQIDWCQQLQSFAQKEPVTVSMQEQATAWLSQNEEHFTGPSWYIIITVYSVISVGTLVAAIAGYIPAAIFSFLYVVYLAIASLLSYRASGAYIQLSGIVKEIATLHQLIHWIESRPFQSVLLNQLQQKIKADEELAAHQIKQLETILGRFDQRLNIFSVLFFNTFLLWDVRQMISLNKWRSRNKPFLAEWFNVISEFEVLNTLAVIRFNYPEWAIPAFTTQHFTFHGLKIGHPLIPQQQRVTSDFDMEGTAKIALVTGSNMAGKSTFLRSLGINTVLAQMGAPVCAEKLLLSPVHLMSSMRIADNLAENTSTFYAELKKLKTIIEAVNRHEQVFILLDEILRGTNSLDRHTGSVALIRQLIREKAVAVIATHDVELATLETAFPSSVRNYHFDVQVEGEELYFDYKLKDGVCTNLNASLLMKKIGIEISED